MFIFFYKIEVFLVVCLMKIITLFFKIEVFLVVCLMKIITLFL
jgi:hypothetical protein